MNTPQFRKKFLAIAGALLAPALAALIGFSLAVYPKTTVLLVLLPTLLLMGSSMIALGIYTILNELEECKRNKELNK